VPSIDDKPGPIERIQTLEREKADLQHELLNLKETVRRLEENVDTADEREEKLQREIARQASAARRLRREEVNEAAHRVRLDAVRSLKKLLRQAQTQAAKGKPALLRLILRSTR